MQAWQLLIFKSFNPVVEASGVSWALVCMPARAGSRCRLRLVSYQILSLEVSTAFGGKPLVRWKGWNDSEKRQRRERTWTHLLSGGT